MQQVTILYNDLWQVGKVGLFEVGSALGTAEDAATDALAKLSAGNDSIDAPDFISDDPGAFDAANREYLERLQAKANELARDSKNPGGLLPTIPQSDA